MWRVTSLIAMSALAITAALASGCASNTTVSALQGRLLSVADLPAGWSAVPSGTPEPHTDAPCLSALSASSNGWTYVSASFVQGPAIPNLGEVLATGPRAQQRWQALNSALARCQTATVTIAGTAARATIKPLAFPQVGSQSSAYAWTLTMSGIRVSADLILFGAGAYVGYVSYSDLGSPPIAAVRAVADAAAVKAKQGSTAPVSSALSIASAPVRSARTTLGDVAYRVTGSGPSLLLITGYGATMEGWDRIFVEDLAEHFRVVIFDNGGIGGTAAPPAPLSIDAMANQTSALISALGLRRPDVLGWSMGSMIAQALAVLHPDQVNRLVLCASYPGTGTAARPSKQAISALDSGSQQQVMADLFPPGQTGAQNTYLASISSYPSAAAAATAIVTAQGQAIDAWWAGQDAAGKDTAAISVPTLIADGTADQLDPLANSYRLADIIPGAKLTLYPDAGHAFLFQDEAAFIPLVESFLA
jgi:pimeloyl-ACP methyl ester carboxylesterase